MNKKEFKISNSKFFFCFLLSAFCISNTCVAQLIKGSNEGPRFVYQSSVSLGYGIGKHYVVDDTLANSNISLEFQQLLAYQFNNYFFTGVGAGVDLWFCEKKVSTFIPIFANATVKFMDKKLAPFMFANIGYAFKWQVQKKSEENIFYGTKAGIYFQSGAGLNVKFSDKISLLVSAFYRLQQSAIQYRETDLLLAESKNQLFHSLGIKIGILY
jgi:hypothetical protein